jgi:hypothetical protein
MTLEESLSDLVASTNAQPHQHQQQQLQGGSGSLSPFSNN